MESSGIGSSGKEMLYMPLQSFEKKVNAPCQKLRPSYPRPFNVPLMMVLWSSFGGNGGVLEGYLDARDRGSGLKMGGYDA